MYMSNLEEININGLNEIIGQGKCSFLYGNGFSMNFDSSFGDIYNRLYENHRLIMKNFKIDCSSPNSTFKNKAITNFKKVKEYVKNFDRRKIRALFEDGIKFAKSINSNEKIKEELLNSPYIIKLVSGETQLTILDELCSCETLEGINIEYWSILIYLYYAIKLIDSSHYTFPLNNKYINAIELGNFVKTSVVNQKDLADILEKTYFNGLTTYYRVLFSATIFNSGKCLNLNDLDKYNKIDREKLLDFLLKFNSILTTNYDCIVEKLSENSIEPIHLHGAFVLDKKEFTYFLSLGINYKDNNYVSFSDVLIGDRFFKTGKSLINSLTSKHYSNKKTIVNTKKIINNMGENTDSILIFGLGLKNDIHIINGIISYFYINKIKNPKIIYSYYDERQKEEFTREMKKNRLITLEEKHKNIKIMINGTREISDYKEGEIHQIEKGFYDSIPCGDDGLEYFNNIKIKVVKVQDILENFFLK